MLMTHLLLTSDLKAPAGTICYECGAPAVVQCSCCDHCMCLQHAHFFGRVPARQYAMHDYVECLACNQDDEQEDEA
jgi:hypothetical protein